MRPPSPHARVFRFISAAGPLPADAIRQAWADETQREELVHALSRDVSKSGAFLSRTLLRELAGALEVADVMWLYERIRDDSRRCESEWRGEFAELCPRAAAALPEPERQEQ